MQTVVLSTACRLRPLLWSMRLLARSLCAARGLSPRSRPVSSLQSMSKKAVKGVIFDMDGTLTMPVIDFAEMRRRCGVLTGDLLDTIASWPADKQHAANQAIKEVEQEALEHMQLMPGLLELCSFLESQNLPRGLVTRNVDTSVKYFHDNHFTLTPFWPALSRDFKPYKPNPGALLHICQQWSILPQEAIMVGDSAKDDVVAGNRAGMDTILLDTTGAYTDQDSLQGEMKPTFTVSSLAEISELLQYKYAVHGASDHDESVSAIVTANQ